MDRSIILVRRIIKDREKSSVKRYFIVSNGYITVLLMMGTGNFEGVDFFMGNSGRRIRIGNKNSDSSFNPTAAGCGKFAAKPLYGYF